MKQLCYVSFLSDGLDVEEVIKSVKEISQVKNAKYNLTGFLIYTNEIFLQLLEGDELNVDITYKIIKNDERNFGHQVLMDQVNTERAFPEWLMKFNYLEKIDLVAINKMLRIADSIKKKDGLSNKEITDLFEKLSSKTS